MPMLSSKQLNEVNDNNDNSRRSFYLLVSFNVNTIQSIIFSVSEQAMQTYCML